MGILFKHVVQREQEGSTTVTHPRRGGVDDVGRAIRSPESSSTHRCGAIAELMTGSKCMKRYRYHTQLFIACIKEKYLSNYRSHLVPSAFTMDVAAGLFHYGRRVDVYTM